MPSVPPTCDVPTPARDATQSSANASSKGLIRNAAFNYVATAIGSLTGFIVTPILVRTLGANQFGLWVLLGSIVGFASLVEMGVSTATAMRVAECRATGDHDRLAKLVATATVMFLGSAVAMLVVTGFVAGWLPRLLHLPPGDIFSARKCFLVLGLNQAVLFLGIVQAAIFFGSGRLDLGTKIGSALGLGAAVANVAVVMAGMGIVALAFVTLGSSVLNVLTMHMTIKRCFPEVRIRLRDASRQHAADLLRFGSKNVALAVGWMLATGSDTLVIGFLLPVANVTHYTVAARLVGFARTLASKPLDVLMPAYSHSHALQDRERMFRLFSRSVTVSLAIALPLVIGLCVFGKVILTLWVGRGHEASYPILILLALCMVFQVPGQAVSAMLIGTGRNGLLVKTVAIAAPCNLLLSIFLTKMLGPAGVALGSLITITIAETLLLPFLVCEEFLFSYASYLTQSMLPLLVPTIAALTYACLARWILESVDRYGAIIACGGSLAVFMLVFSFTKTGKEITRTMLQQPGAFLKGSVS